MIGSKSRANLSVILGGYVGPKRSADVVLVCLDGKESDREWNGRPIKTEIVSEGRIVEELSQSCPHTQWVLISYANPPSPHCRIQCLSGCQFIALVSDEQFAEMNKQGLIKQAPGPPPFIGKW